jgi:hypothetical protein
MNKVRFQVLKPTSMRVAFFWVVATCILIDIDRRFRGASEAIIRAISDESSL